MGEIKSTLELVMERTKHLTLSEEEREEQEHNQLRMKVKGLLQKYQDKMVRKEQLGKELTVLQETYGLPDNKFLSDAIVDELSLDAENGPLLSLLKEFFGFNITGFESVLEDYQGSIQAATQGMINEAKENLAEKHGISGSAVVPNLETDDAWSTAMQELKDKSLQKLDQEKGKSRGKYKF